MSGAKHLDDAKHLDALKEKYRNSLPCKFGEFFKRRYLSNKKILNTVFRDNLDDEATKEEGGGDDDGEEETKEENRAPAKFTRGEKRTHVLDKPSIYTKKIEDFDARLVTDEYVYAASLNDVLLNVEADSIPVTINTAGGIVITPIDKKFKAGVVDDETDQMDYSMDAMLKKPKQTLELIAIDFGSLYPNTMRLFNICPTTIGHNPYYKMQIGDKMFSPFDTSVCYQVATPIAINGKNINVMSFIIKPSVQVSLLSLVITQTINDRSKSKKLLKAAKAEGNTARCVYHNAMQLAKKLKINAMYGALICNYFVSYWPTHGSLVTYFGHLLITRLFFFCFYYFKKRGISVTNRGVRYGDTDSLFFVCLYSEILEILAEYTKQTLHNGVIEVELERRCLMAMFIRKKTYILFECDFGAAMKTSVYGKNVFTNRLAVPITKCLHLLVRLFFEAAFREHYDDFEQGLTAIFNELVTTDTVFFTTKTQLRKDPLSYKTPNTIIKQAILLESMGVKKYSTGDYLIKSFFNHVFQTGACYGFVKNSKQRKLIGQQNQACALLLDFVPFIANSENLRINFGVLFSEVQKLVDLFFPIIDDERVTAVYRRVYEQIIEQNANDNTTEEADSEEPSSSAATAASEAPIFVSRKRRNLKMPSSFEQTVCSFFKKQKT